MSLSPVSVPTSPINNNNTNTKTLTRLPDKYAKFIRFGFFLSQKNITDIENFHQQIHLFDTVEQQIEFVNEFLSLTKQLNKDMRKANTAHRKPNAKPRTRNNKPLTQKTPDTLSNTNTITNNDSNINTQVSVNVEKKTRKPRVKKIKDTTESLPESKPAKKTRKPREKKNDTDTNTNTNTESKPKRKYTKKNVINTGDLLIDSLLDAANNKKINAINAVNLHIKPTLSLINPEPEPQPELQHHDEQQDDDDDDDEEELELISFQFLHPLTNLTVSHFKDQENNIYDSKTLLPIGFINKDNTVVFN